MEWFTSYGWMVWSAIAVLLAVGEMFSVDLVLGMFAVAAIAGAITAAVGGGWGAQVIVVSGVALALLWFVRPPIVRRMHAGPDLKSGTAGLPGRQGTVEHVVTDVGDGRVRIGGEEWSAVPEQPGSTIPTGARIIVVEIKGATAVVRPSQTEE